MVLKEIISNLVLLANVLPFVMEIHCMIEEVIHLGKHLSEQK